MVELEKERGLGRLQRAADGGVGEIDMPGMCWGNGEYDSDCFRLRRLLENKEKLGGWIWSVHTIQMHGNNTLSPMNMYNSCEDKNK